MKESDFCYDVSGTEGGGVSKVPPSGSLPRAVDGADWALVKIGYEETELDFCTGAEQ